MIRRHLTHAVVVMSLFSSILLSSFPDFGLAATVTLDSLELYTTHEWLSEPEVYFQCKEENKTFLPDVKKKHVFYKFKGEESWQPLTDLPEKKCKRCGFYEKDQIKLDDVFDEWELCSSDFTNSDGKYTHCKEKEFNATFLCTGCIPLETASASNNTMSSHHEDKRSRWPLFVATAVICSIVFAIGGIATYKYWQKRKRQQEQARFLKLFEEGDDIEDELGIGPLSHEI